MPRLIETPRETGEEIVTIIDHRFIVHNCDTGPLEITDSYTVRLSAMALATWLRDGLSRGPVTHDEAYQDLIRRVLPELKLNESDGEIQIDRLDTDLFEVSQRRIASGLRYREVVVKERAIIGNVTFKDLDNGRVYICNGDAVNAQDVTTLL